MLGCQSLIMSYQGGIEDILSRTLEEAPAGCVLMRTIDEAAEAYRDQELMVIGGAEIYAATVANADRLLLTELAQPFDGDAYFPEYDREEWRLVSREEGVIDERNAIPHAYCVYERVGSK